MNLVLCMGRYRRRQWQPTPVLLPGKSHGQRNLVGHSSWECKRVGHDLTHTFGTTAHRTLIRSCREEGLRRASWGGVLRGDGKGSSAASPSPCASPSPRTTTKPFTRFTYRTQEGDVGGAAQEAKGNREKAPRSREGEGGSGMSRRGG